MDEYFNDLSFASLIQKPRHAGAGKAKRLGDFRLVHILLIIELGNLNKQLIPYIHGVCPFLLGADRLESSRYAFVFLQKMQQPSDAVEEPGKKFSFHKAYTAE